MMLLKPSSSMMAFVLLCSLMAPLRAQRPANAVPTAHEYVVEQEDPQGFFGLDRRTLMGQSSMCEMLQSEHERSCSVSLNCHGKKCGKKKKVKQDSDDGDDLLCLLLQVQIQSGCSPEVCFPSEESSLLTIGEDTLGDLRVQVPEDFSFDSCEINFPEDSNVGVCYDEHYCAYALEELCASEDGQIFSSSGSCGNFGFTRLLEYYSSEDSDYKYAGPSKTCIRESNNLGFDEMSSSYCQQNRMTLPTNDKSAICACGFDGLLGDGVSDDGVESSCASRGLPHHVKLPDSNGNDVDTCMMLSETLPKCAPWTPSGSCEGDCATLNFFRKMTLGLVKAIPTAGTPLSMVLGFLWPKLGPTIETAVNDLVQYVDERIHEAQSQTLLTVVNGHLLTIRKHAEYLEENESTLTKEMRVNKWDDINDECVKVWALLQSIENGGTVPHEKSIPYISTIGQTCISLLSIPAYHSEKAIGEFSSDIETLFKGILTDTVHIFSNLSEAANQAALDWRMDGIEVKPYSASYSYYRLYDYRCSSVYGPIGVPYHTGSTTGFVASTWNEGGAMRLQEIYKLIMADGFRDGVQGEWNSNVHNLWKYYLPDEVAAGNQPQPVLRVATSSPLLLYSRPMCNGHVYHLCTDDKLFFNEDLYHDTKTGTFDRNFHLESVTFYSYDFNYPWTAGIELKGPGGYYRALGCVQPGLSCPSRDLCAVYTHNLDPDERIVAFWRRGFMAFQTAYVNGTGAFAREGKWYGTSSPDGEYESIDIHYAPAVATFRNASFLPHIIDIVGWTGDYFGREVLSYGSFRPTRLPPSMSVPLWLYEIEE